MRLTFYFLECRWVLIIILILGIFWKQTSWLIGNFDKLYEDSQYPQLNYQAEAVCMPHSTLYWEGGACFRLVGARNPPVSTQLTNEVHASDTSVLECNMPAEQCSSMGFTRDQIREWTWKETHISRVLWSTLAGTNTYTTESNEVAQNRCIPRIFFKYVHFLGISWVCCAHLAKQ